MPRTLPRGRGRRGPVPGNYSLHGDGTQRGTGGGGVEWLSLKNEHRIGRHGRDIESAGFVMGASVSAQCGESCMG